MFLAELFTNPIFFFRYVAIVIVSVSVHELAHGWAAVAQGDDTPQRTGHLTPNPLVHMGLESIIFLCVAGIAVGQMPVNPAKFRSPRTGNILVSVAGPFSNLALGLLCIIAINLIVTTSFAHLWSVNFFLLAAQINFVLFLFNLLPAPPLDGFRVLCEFFPEFKQLDDTIGLFLLMILLLMPNTVTGLVRIADIAIEAMTGL
ncbi:MAG: site-2 protease family protein [Stenomitos rutilans HA7619-LM2]|jgi:Zn-dependent protease|nr:site-2 protease family protein [Stenomitos rutilans HA7619-LM2]